MTTDPFPKEHAVRVETAAGAFHVGGTAKGSGMIEPKMATMLGFLTTDARSRRRCCSARWWTPCDDTFNAITVDGECSTNDCCSRWPPAPAASSSTTSRYPALLEGLPRGLPRAGDRHRPRRRGRDQADRRARDRRADRRRRPAGGAGHRQLAARQDGGPRRRPELGPPRRRGRPRGRRFRWPARRVTSAASCCSSTACRTTSARRRRPRTCRARTSASTSTSAPAAARTRRSGPAT